MVLPQGRKGEQGAVKRVGLYAVRSSDEERFFPVYQNDDGQLFVAIMTPIDEITGAVVTIDSFHHEIHEAETFITSHYLASINNNATIILHLTPGTHFDHLTFTGSCGGDALMEVFENPDVDADGVAELEVNMKFTSAAVSDTVVVSDPTVNVDGTFKFECLLPGGTGGTAQGGISGLRDDSEFILDPTATYMVRLTNISGNAKPACLIAQWYEESDN